MKEISEQEAKQLRFEILQEIDRFCTERNIRYFLGFGTLLGAVRHQGFIPWDDDCDVIIPRPDLERFEKEYVNNERFELINNRQKNCHFYGFDRLVDRRTYNQLGPFNVTGINVELYPIDGLPLDEVQQHRFFKKILEYREREDVIFHRTHHLASCYNWPFTKLKIWPFQHFFNRYYRFGSQYEYELSKEVCLVFGNPYRLKPLNKEWFDYGERLVFEGISFSVPKDYDSYLTSVYGDYMTPPPPEKRIPAHGGCYFWKQADFKDYEGDILKILYKILRRKIKAIIKLIIKYV